MEIKHWFICILLGLSACSSPQNHIDKKTDSAASSTPVVHQPCQTLSFSQMLDESLWQQLYTEHAITVENQLQPFAILELTQQEFEEHANYASGALGIPLGDVGDLDLDSNMVSVTKDGSDYLIDLQEDNLSFKLPQNFNLQTIVKFREDPDAGFENLCTNSDASIIQIAKFVLFKSASSMYLYQLKQQGSV